MILQICRSVESAAGDRRKDVDHRGGADRGLKPDEAAYVLTVDEDVDMAAQRSRLVPDPRAELRSADQRGIQDGP
jgi:hypothetical protein